MGMHNVRFVFIFVRKCIHTWSNIDPDWLEEFGFGSYKNTTAIALPLDLALVHVKCLIHI